MGTQSAVPIEKKAALAPEDLELLIEAEKERRSHVLLFDQLMDATRRRWLDHDLENAWEAL